MAKVNGVPGFTNFKKVNILDTFLIKGQSVSALDQDTPETITGGWTFNTSPTTFDSDLIIGFGSALQLEDSVNSITDALFLDGVDDLILNNGVANGNIDFQTNGTGEVLVNGASIGFDPTANQNITGDWTWSGIGSITYSAGTPMIFSLPETEDAIRFDNTTESFNMWIYYDEIGVNNVLQFEPGSGAVKDGGNRFGYDFDTEVWFVEANFRILSGGLFDFVLGATARSFLTQSVDAGFEIGDVNAPMVLVAQNHRVQIDTLSNAGSPIGQLQFYQDQTTALGDLSYLAANPETLQLRNLITNADIDLVTTGTGQVFVNGSPIISNSFDMANNVFLTGEDTGATARNLIGMTSGDVIQVGNLAAAFPLNMQTNGAITMSNSASAISVTAGDTLGLNSANALTIESTASSVNIISSGNSTTTVGSTYVMDAVSSYTLRVNGSFSIQGTPTVTSMWFSGAPKISTADNTLTAAGSGGTVTDPQGVSRSIGFNQANENVEAASFTVAVDTPGETYNYTGAGTHTATLGAATDWHPQSMQMIMNAGTGTLTIAPTGGDVLTWFSGSALATGSRILAIGGVCTVYNFSNSDLRIWGSGLT